MGVLQLPALAPRVLAQSKGLVRVSEPLIMWTVYHGCTDMPPHVWRVRMFEITAEGAKRTSIEYDLLSFGAIELRWGRGMGLYWQPRHESDPPRIVGSYF